MNTLPNCPKCQSAYTYEDGTMFVCPECAHEWSISEDITVDLPEEIKDVNGQVLKDGDSVTVIKDLKVKGTSSILKQGIKVKNIRLMPNAADGHNIECKIDGFGGMKLKSEVVKKA